MGGKAERQDEKIHSGIAVCVRCTPRALSSPILWGRSRQRVPAMITRKLRARDTVSDLTVSQGQILVNWDLVASICRNPPRVERQVEDGWLCAWIKPSDSEYIEVTW